MSTAPTRQRLVIYTCLTGGKEPLGNPLALLPPGSTTDLELSFVCFTDQPALSSPVWEVRPIGDRPLPGEKLSRRPKTMPHEYLREWDFSLYVDNVIVFKRLPQASDLATARPYLFKLFRHEVRSHLEEEAAVIAQVAYDGMDRVCAQLDFYEKFAPIAEIGPLSTCPVIFRQHHHPDVVRFGVTWWEQILNFSKRDQMSFDFSVRYSGIELERLPGTRRDSDLIFHDTKLVAKRVIANFDPVRYAWLNRSDATARADPVRHYLEHAKQDLRLFARRLEVFEYLCQRFRSSLGARVAPRRQLARTLQDLLQDRCGRAGRTLLLRVHERGETAYGAEEMLAAEQVFCVFLGIQQGLRAEVDAAQLATGQLVYGSAEDPAARFDSVIAIGASAALWAPLAGLLRHALKPGGGMLCVLGSKPGSVGEAAALEGAISTCLGVPARLSLQGALHDSVEGQLSNSVAMVQWG
ncbi:MAG: hypothetical protein JO369_08345 [Paucibacter sp.]|nr:hypothetical protein [Roseateles sp.]